MRNYLMSERIRLNHDQDISEVKKFLYDTLSQIIDLKEISPSNDYFFLKGTTGGMFDFVRKTRIYADVNMIVEETKNEKELKIFVKGNAVISYSMAFSYLVLFSLILFAGLLPGSIETDSENSTALDALVFLLIGFYIKTEIDKSLLEAEEHIRDTLKLLKTRFSV